jgi:hypothetical protein
LHQGDTALPAYGKLFLYHPVLQFLPLPVPCNNPYNPFNPPVIVLIIKFAHSQLKLWANYFNAYQK